MIHAWRPNLSRKRLYRFRQFVDDIAESGVLTDDKYCRLLERKIAELSGVKDCVVVSNCTAGLEACLQYYRDVYKVKTVVTSSLCFVADWLPAQRLGLKVKMYDVKDDAFVVKVMEKQEDAVLLPVWNWGWYSAKYEGLLREIGMPMVSDLAHCLGSVYRIEGLGVYSFHATKMITGGEGGAVIGNNEKALQYIDYLKDYGMPSRLAIYQGSNWKMSEITAAFVLSGLELLYDDMDRCLTNYRIYADELPIREIKASGWTFNGYLVPLIVKNREKVETELLNKYGIETFGYNKYMPNEHPVFKGEIVSDERSKMLTRETVFLPNHPQMGEETVKYVIESVKSVLKDEHH